jgi:predicted AlkP superfamily pyrophosphatase or phosphodiesterase
LTGVEATKHLVDSNDDLAEMDFTYATMVQRAVDAGFDAKVVTNWFGIAVLTEDGLDKQTFPGNDVAVGDAAVAHVSGAAPQLLFLQFDQVDVAGHLHGFSPDIPQYVTAIENVDDLVGEIVDAVVERPTIAQENWLFVVVTDHSGQDKDHGPMDAIHQTIPLAFAGPTVPHETLLSTGGADPGPSHMDVAPSAYAFLGITTSDEWSLDGVARVTAP